MPQNSVQFHAFLHKRAGFSGLHPISSVSGTILKLCTGVSTEALFRGICEQMCRLTLFLLTQKEGNYREQYRVDQLQAGSGVGNGYIPQRSSSNVG